MKISTQLLVILSISLFIVVGLCLILILTGTVTPFISSFAVDSNDRLYIGIQNEIRVYEEDILINTINPKTSRAYVFTIDKHNNILLSTSTKKYLMDLDGNVLDVQEDQGANMYNQIQYNRKKFVSVKGDVYKLTSAIGWTRIIKNGEDIVYQISLLSFAVKVLIAVIVIFLISFPLWMLKRFNITQ